MAVAPGAWSKPSRRGRAAQFFYENVGPTLIEGAKSVGQGLVAEADRERRMREEAALRAEKRAQEKEDIRGQRAFALGTQGVAYPEFAPDEAVPGLIVPEFARRQGVRETSLLAPVPVVGTYEEQPPFVIEGMTFPQGPRYIPPPAAAYQEAQTGAAARAKKPEEMAGYVRTTTAPAPRGGDPYGALKAAAALRRAGAAEKAAGRPRPAPRGHAPPNVEDAMRKALADEQRAADREHARKVEPIRRSVETLLRSALKEYDLAELQAITDGVLRGEALPPSVAKTPTGQRITAQLRTMPAPPDSAAIAERARKSWNQRRRATGMPEWPAGEKEPGSRLDVLNAKVERGEALTPAEEAEAAQLLGGAGGGR